MNTELTVNARSSCSRCSRSPSSLVSAPLQFLPYLELIVHTLGAWNKQPERWGHTCEVLRWEVALGAQSTYHTCRILVTAGKLGIVDTTHLSRLVTLEKHS